MAVHFGYDGYDEVTKGCFRGVEYKEMFAFRVFLVILINIYYMAKCMWTLLLVWDSFSWFPMKRNLHATAYNDILTVCLQLRSNSLCLSLSYFNMTMSPCTKQPLKYMVYSLV